MERCPKGSSAAMFRDETERRLKPRINGPIRAKVYCTALSGESIEIMDAALNNLSTSGLHVCLEHPVAEASSLQAIISIGGVEVMANGIVRRVETRPDGSFGLGVEFENYSVLSE